VEHEVPALLAREGLRSIKMKPGEFVHQTRETFFSLFVVNCCMEENFDSKPYHDKTGRTLYLTNTALTAGVEITDERISAYRAAREGASADSTTKKSPRQQARDSVFVTSGFCCVSVDNNKNLVGNCPKCIKKMGWDCPSVLNVRKITKGYAANGHPRILMSVYSGGSAKKNGNSKSEFLSGKKIAKWKTKRSTLLHDPPAWLAQRTDKYLYETCLGLMILPKREAGVINPSKFRERPELIKQLLAMAADPKAFRKIQEDQRLSSADRELGAYGYSDFTSVLYEEMRAQKEDLGLAKPEQLADAGATSSPSGCEDDEESMERKCTGGNPLPFITQEDDDLCDL
jgi:hypothetical protein